MDRSAVPYIVIVLILILICCLCGVVVVSVGIYLSANAIEITEVIDNVGETLQPMQDVEIVPEEISPPTPEIIQPEAASQPQLDASQQDEVSMRGSVDTLEILENSIVPINDWVELAGKFEGKENIPLALDPVTEVLPVGTKNSFWVLDTDDDEIFQVDTTLRYVTDHTYFWIEDGVQYNERKLRELAETFEDQIYPTNRAYFGSEWSPGVDGDPHLYIIYATGLGDNLAGYFSSADEYHPLAQEYSNMHETFMLSADNSDLGDDYTYGVLAHEFQHMIHWYQDRNESSWLNEGFSELAVFLNGYDTGGFDVLYTETPDMQLNDWPNDPSQTAPHYGASFLFVVYFLDRFGSEATQAIVHHPGNGMSSIDSVLDTLDARDPITGDPVRADDVFLDWTLAAYLKDDDILDGRYTYNNYSQAPQANDTEEIESCPTGLESRDVNQYGVDYIRINCGGDFTLHFEGAVDVEVVPTEPHSGSFAFWSNKGDDSNMTLTRTFDFSSHTDPLTLKYWTWYDIEEDWDYVYLVSSLDGESWQFLSTPSGTAEDPIGNSFGWGYTGLSGVEGSWIQEEVDLSEFAGKSVQIRFEYITDASVHGEGFLLDDVAIPEIGYTTDFENGSDGWEAAGFVRIENSLPQTFKLALIEDGKITLVKYLDLGEGNTLEIPVKFDDRVYDVVLVITGTSRFTRQKAIYQFQLIVE